MTEKRFTEIISTQIIIDNVTGEHYNAVVDDDFLKLINDINRRADRNAELLDMDKIALEHQMIELKQLNEIYLHTVKRVNKLLKKYEIDNLEKLDRILFERGVW